MIRKSGNDASRYFASLVTDEYLKEGEGYIGIALAMKDDIVTVPGDPKPRNVIRVMEVRADTPRPAGRDSVE